MPSLVQSAPRPIAPSVEATICATRPNASLFPVNYGYVPGVAAPDGEDLDAYVLGIFEPMREFTGRCIAVIERLDDADDKLVVVPDGRAYTDEQIQALVEFQEQWFKSVIWRG